MPPKRNQLRNKKRKEKGKESEEKKEKKEEPYFEDIIHIEENNAKDFEFLLNAPVSEDDHFVFKSEKDWTVDASKYSELFMLDLKLLSAAIESIPFNETVDIDKKYFTDDQLADIYNNAEQGKEKYKELLSNLKTTVTNDTKDDDKESSSEYSLEGSTDDLDFLLSLQKPVNDSSVLAKSLPLSLSSDCKVKHTPSTSTKPLDLEKWLDSVLDD
ncbi:uncharacterized protein LOC143427292 [Xylocopa sonorina]|uniref:uncharacterized protein LOC143427292 n=1 Tax=Xylocopa sonorina TaxID=1818115 RepID=UPI00403AC10B